MVQHLYDFCGRADTEHASNAERKKLLLYFLMFMGLTIFAIFAGTVSAFMVDRLRVEGRIVEFGELQDHIVICGWTPKTEVIIKEYRAGKQTRNTPIVVITEMPADMLESYRKTLSNVMFLHDDFTKVSALHRAGIESAQNLPGFYRIRAAVVANKTPTRGRFWRR